MTSFHSPLSPLARCYWLTGLPGAGKTTLAHALHQAADAQGLRAIVLDGDTLRKGLNRDLAFDRAARRENVRRMAEVAKLLVDAGLIVFVAAISPYREDREAARALFPQWQFAEIFVSTDLGTCAARDPKGLYARARRGELSGLTGWSDAYEAPARPESRIDTAGLSVAEAAGRVLRDLGAASDRAARQALVRP